MNLRQLRDAVARLSGFLDAVDLALGVCLDHEAEYGPTQTATLVFLAMQKVECSSPFIRFF